MEADIAIDDAAELTLNLKKDLVPELKTIQDAEGKFGSLTLFIVTLIIFFSAEIVTFSIQEILILIGVLFVHEAGHFIQMKYHQQTGTISEFHEKINQPTGLDRYNFEKEGWNKGRSIFKSFVIKQNLPRSVLESYDLYSIRAIKGYL